MGRKRNRRELGIAWANEELVLARRSIWKADVLEGYVVALAPDWAAVNLVYDVGLNGWAIVRLDTVREVERHPVDGFLPRALTVFGHEPEPVEVDLSSPRAIIRSLATTFPLISVFTEADDPAVCAIGRPVRTGRQRLRLLDIGPDAEWDDEPRGFRYEDITRIDVGGRYEIALHALGGYPPVPT